MADDDVPAGWFPTPDGKQRYWDGSKWTSLPWDGDPVATVPKKSRKRLIRGVAIAAAAILAISAVTVGLSLKSNADAEAAAEVAAQVAADKEAERLASEAARQAAADRAERKARTESIVGIEGSIKTMAEEHAADGIIDGPIIDVSCSPLGGGSTDDLTEQTTVFDCFVANLDNGDGTLSGYYYNATMNWSTGAYTYGFGRA